MTPRTQLYAILAAGCAAILIAAVLYGINGGGVHATAAPPAVLDKLKVTESRPVAPDVGFADGTGMRVQLGDFRGRYVLVNLWATWCGPCINELPELAKLQKELPQDRMTVVPIDILERLDAEKVGEFLKMHGAGDLPVYIDREFSTQRGFLANELPLTILIDSEGHEIARAAGAQAWDAPASVAYFKALSAPQQPK
jgi:thiol-disulfide isomerase/thioredoxin